jgi:periplasmic protein CpxP/Spy
MTINARTVWMSLVVALVAIVGLTIGTISAQGPDGRRDGQPAMGQGRGPGRGAGPVLHGLDLTDAQREQVRSILEANRPDAASVSKAAELQRELRAAVFADAPDQAKIDQLKAALSESHAAALSARIETELKIAQVLTAEQRAKARELPARGPRGRGRGRM